MVQSKVHITIVNVSYFFWGGDDQPIIQPGFYYEKSGSGGSSPPLAHVCICITRLHPGTWTTGWSASAYRGSGGARLAYLHQCAIIDRDVACR